ncbi:MAG: response regulator transcription factor [Bacteroidetes bacterium]|nr:MAG: response regulator transcription factor [Bacteroidota bacterium]
MKSKIGIVEDEFTIAMDLQHRVQKMGFEVPAVALNYQEALSMLVEQNLDLLLLDINLEEEKNGIDIARIVREKFALPFIFLTAYTDDKTFDEASETFPMGYLSKPFRDEDLKHSINLALRNFKPGNLEKQDPVNQEAIFLKEKGKYVKIAMKDIVWLEAMDNYTLIHTEEGRFVINRFLGALLESLGQGFIRIHRSHAVSLSRITSVEESLVYLGEKYLPVSKSYRADLMQKIKLT